MATATSVLSLPTSCQELAQALAERCTAEPSLRRAQPCRFGSQYRAEARAESSARESAPPDVYLYHRYKAEPMQQELLASCVSRSLGISATSQGSSA